MHKKILIYPPTEGIWENINRDIAQIKPNLVIVAGNFGYLPALDRKGIPYPNEDSAWYMLEGIESKVPVMWIDGPIDDQGALISQGRVNKNAIQIYPNCLYIPRGVVVRTMGVSLLLLGGVREHTERGQEGVSWWNEEVFTDKDMARVKDCDIPIDYIISYDYRVNFKELHNIRCKEWISGKKLKGRHKVLEVYHGPSVRHRNERSAE